jgi:sec-independent protein translocase protein TatB
MFDFDAGKLIIIGIVALIVIGPKELPRVMRQVGQGVGKLRRMAAEFQGQFMEAMREAEVADLKADMTKLAESAKIDVGFNPVAEFKSQITEAIASGDKAPPAPADAPALAAPHNGDFPSIGDSTPAQGAPATPLDAEMKALASALEAEMRSAEPSQSHAEGSKAQDPKAQSEA